MNVLILDDEPAIGKSIQDFLQESGIETHTALRVDEALAIMEKQSIDLLFLDINLPDVDGISFLRNIKPLYPDLQVIMISGIQKQKTIIEAMRLGAIDYLVKPFKLSDVQLAITRSENFLQTHQALSQTASRFKKLSGLLDKGETASIIFNSAKMAEVIRMAEMVARVEEMPVLISGESGTGKELIAKYIHKKSQRNKQLFIATNCASIPNELFESEFFGHIKGSFTGAIDDQAGLFELANGGILFLDEISEMDIRHQAKLLRVLESKEIKRIGGKRIQSVKTRIIATTNRDLKKMSADNMFRNDLYHRLSVFEIHLPPLRERKDDIEPLVESFIKTSALKFDKKVAGYEPQLIDSLLQYDFPGNVRELRNIIERAIIVSHSEKLRAEDILNHGVNETLGHPNSEKSHSPLTLANLNLEAHEKQLVIQALERAENNKHKAARLLGITPQALRRRMEKYRLFDY
jgi:DNA-binding NtrC family response regulator